ncbi:Hypothetical protein D9617_10g072470 [Elsinoe fawcettii]|nr:Hypothetical protein D9617_10g072470 [Elsinoe fawcettii]
MQLQLFVAALLGSTATAQSLSTIVNSQCFTRYSIRTTNNIRTTNFATTTRRTAVLSVTNTPVQTVTPAAVTSSVTSTRTIFTTTTVPTRTNTYTTSVTLTTTQTDTEIESYTQTITTSSTTTVQSTTTVPAPAGFTNLANMPGYYAKRNAVVEKREALQARDEVKNVIPIISPAQPQPTAAALFARQNGSARKQYPVAVSCTASSTIITTRRTTITAATSTTTAAVPTVFVTQTSTVTVTRTSVPADATKIITVSTDTQTSTSTSTTSTTQTSTSTFTVNVASATFLAQCAPNNIVGSAVGQKIGTISFNKAFTLQSLYVKDTSGYGCCAQCATSTNCAGYAQAPGSGACYYLTTDGRCDVGQSWGDRFHYYNTNGDGYRVGNGQCGFLGPQAGIPPQVA